MWGLSLPASLRLWRAPVTLEAHKSGTVSVVRTNKGDRLPLAFKRTSTTSSPAVSTLPRPPIGCEPAFSRNADPARAHIFGRCIS